MQNNSIQQLFIWVKLKPLLC
uniref:Uncharacterized protein n=1 Tax=Arundo donax TaxID=35708 RepID=A0A0A8XRM7_ARUDO